MLFRVVFFVVFERMLDAERAAETVVAARVVPARVVRAVRDWALRDMMRGVVARDTVFFAVVRATVCLVLVSVRVTVLDFWVRLTLLPSRTAALAIPIAATNVAMNKHIFFIRLYMCVMLSKKY